jgi:hypothetical protein
MSEKTEYLVTALEALWLANEATNNALTEAVKAVRWELAITHGEKISPTPKTLDDARILAVDLGFDAYGHSFTKKLPYGGYPIYAWPVSDGFIWIG